jgi:hypothetical protein
MYLVVSYARMLAHKYGYMHICKQTNTHAHTHTHTHTHTYTHTHTHTHPHTHTHTHTHTVSSNACRKSRTLGRVEWDERIWKMSSM